MLNIKTLSIFCTSVSLSVVGISEAKAGAFNPAPIYTDIGSYTTTITGDNNLADIYFPKSSDVKTSADKFPVALLLQGALVDKSNYSSYAKQIAGYGFVVVAPNSKLFVSGLGEALVPRTDQINTALQQIVLENTNPSSPIAGIVDTQKVGLLGHSQGGAVGLSAIGNLCVAPALCPGSFTRPEQIKAGAFYGANLRDQNDVFFQINNDGIPIALLQGDLDGRALPFRAALTYDNIQDPPKTLINIAGANHFSITNTNNPPGAISDPIQATLLNDLAIETIARWSGLFLRASILNDKDAFNYVYFTGDVADPNVTVKSERVPESAPTVALLGVGISYAASFKLRKRTVSVSKK